MCLVPAMTGDMSLSEARAKTPASTKCLDSGMPEKTKAAQAVINLEINEGKNLTGSRARLP
jgi:hypothetical protein